MEAIFEKELLRGEADSAWKESLHLYFKDFIQLCWPKAFQNINWQKGFEFLEQELLAIGLYRKKDKRVVDKLIKVWEKKGNQTFLLIHVEIQQQKHSNFPERMFIYQYRLFDRHRVPVVSLGVLIDAHENWRPNIYERKWCDFNIRMEYPIVKILDYKNQMEALIKSTNPFAIIILSQLAAIETKNQYERRYEVKFNIIKGLYKKGWSKQQIIQIFNFFDALLVLPGKLALKFKEEVFNYEKELNVSYINSIQRICKEEGLQQGLQKGVQQGIKQGESTLLIFQLESKFKCVPEKYIQRVKKANPDILLVWAKRVLTAETLEEIFEN